MIKKSKFTVQGLYENKRVGEYETDNISEIEEFRGSKLDELQINANIKDRESINKLINFLYETFPCFVGDYDKPKKSPYLEKKRDLMRKNLDKLIKENERLSEQLKNVNKKEVSLVIEAIDLGGTKIDSKKTSIMVNDGAHNQIYLHIGQHTYRIDKKGKILSEINLPS